MSSWGGTSVRGRVSMMGGPLYATIDRWGGGGVGERGITSGCQRVTRGLFEKELRMFAEISFAGQKGRLCRPAKKF